MGECKPLVLGDHAAAEATRRRVLEARMEAASEAAGEPRKNADDAGTGTNGESGGGSGKVQEGGGQKMGIMKAATMAKHDSAIARASEAGAHTRSR